MAEPQGRILRLPGRRKNIGKEEIRKLRRVRIVPGDSRGGKRRRAMSLPTVPDPLPVLDGDVHLYDDGHPPTNR